MSSKYKEEEGRRKRREETEDWREEAPQGLILSSFLRRSWHVDEPFQS